LSKRKGICYDFSTLYAAFARAVGLKTKVISGNLNNNNKNIYHSWNEVYIKELEKWLSLDTSSGSITKENFFDNLDTEKKYLRISEK
jgi:transglutaminase-like putative cysteine protease